MESITSLLAIALAAILVNNFVLSQFLGICPFMGVSKKVETALGMGMAVTFVMGVASAVNWPINELLNKLNLGFMQTVTFILVIASLVQFVEMFLQKSMPALYESLGVFLPLITTNCAVLGVTMNNISDGYTFWESMVCALGCGLGYLLAMVIFSGVRSRVDESTPSPAFDGLPITLVAAAIVSLSFFGFSGVITNLFG